MKIANFTLLGDACVGKTALIERFVNDTFNDQYNPTIDPTDSSKKTHVNGIHAYLSIKDTSGEQIFKSNFQSIYYQLIRSYTICVLVYDTTNLSSFENIKKLYNEFKSLYFYENLTFLLLGNKCDKAEKLVDTSTAAQFAKENGDMLFFEVSAKTSQNVVESFLAAADYYYKNKAPEDDILIPESVVVLEDHQEEMESEKEVTNELKTTQNNFAILLKYVRLLEERLSQYEKIHPLNIQALAEALYYGEIEIGTEVKIKEKMIKKMIK